MSSQESDELLVKGKEQNRRGPGGHQQCLSVDMRDYTGVFYFVIAH